MEDYIPFMDQYPELRLVPTTSINIGISNFQEKFDYVQDLNRKNKSGEKEHFHLLVKDGKFGVLLHSSGLFSNTSSVALPALHDSIEFLYKKNKSFGAIIQKGGKFGLYFWEYGVLTNKRYIVPTEFDSMAVMENKRIKGIKDNTVTYFDETGHVLK